jgi:hypothetical protein
MGTAADKQTKLTRRVAIGTGNTEVAGSVGSCTIESDQDVRSSSRPGPS